MIAGKVSETTYYQIERYREMYGGTRSQVVANAVHYYLNSVECVRCGALNPYNGVVCSVCGASIYSEEEIAARGEEGLNNDGSDLSEKLLKTFENKDDYAKYIIKKFLNEGYTPYFSLCRDRNENRRKYKIRLTFMKNDINVSPAERDLTVDFPGEDVYEFLKDMGEKSYSPVSNIIMNKMRMSELHQELMPSDKEESEE